MKDSCRFLTVGFYQKRYVRSFNPVYWIILENDITRPLVNITYPAYPPTITTGKIIIQGTANDFDSGIRNVSAVCSYYFPFDGHFHVKLASQPIPISPDNWSHWSVPLVINKTGTYRVLIEARDNAGNPNWAETTINVPIREKNNTDSYDLI